MRVLVTVLLALILAVPALAQDQGEVRKYFKDWLGACRADGYCSATAYVNPGASGTVADYILRVGRQAQQSYWEVSFTTVATQGDEWSNFDVSVDANTTSFSLADEIGAYGSVNEFYLLGDKAQQVMDWMTPGRLISIAFKDTAGAAHTAQFPLAGLTTALLWIDEQQNRIGSERVASAPPYGLVPTSASQAETPQIPIALLDRQRADPECQPFEDLPNGRDFTVDKLDDSNTLYIVPCWGAAYNFGSKVYVDSYDTFTPQYFADYGGADLGWMGTPFVVNYDYDPATKTLTTFSKARGIGDCGSQGTWTWNRYMFRLEELRYADCSDEIDENAEVPEFPVVYTARPVAAEPAN